MTALQITKIRDSINKLDLDIDTRPLNILKRNGIKYIYTLAMMTEDQVKSIRNIGIKGFTQIYVAMDADIMVPLCKTIEESKDRFRELFGYIYNNEHSEAIRNVDGNNIKFDYNYNGTEYCYYLTIRNKSGLENRYSFNKDQLLIMYNWEETTWKNSFKCGDIII